MIDFSLDLFNQFRNLGLEIIDFLNEDILGYPVVYWLLGGGVILYLTWRIIQATTPL